ncbi:MAG: ribbon-helix-helix domain-containing protein [Parvularcula sp.]|jgi:predicted DNA-binding ribbon-helix-helix protein|nr:ribbon-helix-helix domain-containing protein [Parvularcula sp.]
MKDGGAFQKRSVSLGGHRTSVSLEAAFWTELERLAEEQTRSLASLLAEIDRDRAPEQNLASALRLHVLEALTARRDGR